MAKTEDGKTIVNGAGIPTVDGSKKETIGSSTPNFLMGINTRLSWKGFTLSAVFDWRNGGYFYSHTASTLAFAGNATYTVFNERQSFVVPNSVRLVNGQYVETIFLSPVPIPIIIIIIQRMPINIEIGYCRKII